MNSKRKAGFTLLAVILGLIISPAVAIEDSTFSKNIANLDFKDSFYKKEIHPIPNELPNLTNSRLQFGNN